MYDDGVVVVSCETTLALPFVRDTSRIELAQQLAAVVESVMYERNACFTKCETCFIRRKG